MALASLLSLLLLAGVALPESAVLVATRAIEPLPHTLTLPEKVGLFEAGEHRALAYEVSGRLETLAEEGSRVEAGDVISELDNELERVQLRQAELQLRHARSELKRLRTLHERQAASQKALEDAETQAGLRLAERDAAKERIQRRTLVAPFAGVVAETLFESGEVVTPGSAVALFMDLSTLRLEVGVPAYQVADVVEGARVLVSTPALPEQRFEGRVERVAPAAAQGRHLFEVEIRVTNPGLRLRPGMSARVRIVTNSLDSAFVIPMGSAVERNGGRVVFFVEEGRAHAVPVDAAVLHDDQLILTESLPYRELVVRGQRDLRDGATVRVDNTVLTGAPDADGTQAEVKPVADGPRR